MTDCSCKGLGKRLRDLETQEFLKKAILFDIPEWVLVGEVYELAIPTSIHTKGANPLVQVEEDTGSGFDEIGLHNMQWAVNGDVTLVVTANPDGRFKGRAVFT